MLRVAFWAAVAYAVTAAPATTDAPPMAAAESGALGFACGRCRLERGRREVSFVNDISLSAELVALLEEHGGDIDDAICST